MVGNEFRGVKANDGATLGNAVALRAWSNNNWVLTGRLNRFVSNEADVHVMTGVYTTPSAFYSASAYKFPGGKFEFNRFDSSVKFAFALTDLLKISGTPDKFGALKGDGHFNTATVTGTYTLQKNWWGHKSGPGGNSMTGNTGATNANGLAVSKNTDVTNHWTTGSLNACAGALALYDAGTSACVANSAACPSGKGDYTTRTCTA